MKYLRVLLLVCSCCSLSLGLRIELQLTDTLSARQGDTTPTDDSTANEADAASAASTASTLVDERESADAAVEAVSKKDEIARQIALGRYAELENKEEDASAKRSIGNSVLINEARQYEASKNEESNAESARDRLETDLEQDVESIDEDAEKERESLEDIASAQDTNEDGSMEQMEHRSSGDDENSTKETLNKADEVLSEVSANDDAEDQSELNASRKDSLKAGLQAKDASKEFDIKGRSTADKGFTPKGGEITPTTLEEVLAVAPVPSLLVKFKSNKKLPPPPLTCEEKLELAKNNIKKHAKESQHKPAGSLTDARQNEVKLVEASAMSMQEGDDMARQSEESQKEATSLNEEAAQDAAEPAELSADQDASEGEEGSAAEDASAAEGSEEEEGSLS